MRESIRRSKQKEIPGQVNAPEAKTTPIPNSALESILAGRTRADSKTLGHRQNLAPSLMAKMNRAFGMDLSGVQVYRSEAMEEHGAKGLASGNKIVLSGEVDLNTIAGQAVLGHELSHVRAQSLGIGMGHSGLYENASLEQEADAQGMLAAQGQSIFGENLGMNTGFGMSDIGGLTPLGTGMSASAGVPMQAKGKGKEGKKGKLAGGQKNDPADFESVINGVQWKNGADDQTFGEYSKGRPNAMTSMWSSDYLASHGDLEKKEQWGNMLTTAESTAKAERKAAKAAGVAKEKWPASYKEMLGGAMKQRLIPEFANIDGIEDEVVENVASTDKEKNALAKKRIRELYYQELLRKEKKWGKLLQQMDLNDILSRGGAGGFAADIGKGLQMYDVNKDENGFRFGDERDERYEQLHH